MNKQTLLWLGALAVVAYIVYRIGYASGGAKVATNNAAANMTVE